MCSKKTRQIVLAALAAAIVARQGRAQTQPATELFHLRSECAALEKEIYHEKQRDYSANGLSYFTHYSQATNHCYVQIAIGPRYRPPAPTDRLALAILLDAQRHEMLAFAYGGDVPYGDIGDYDFGNGRCPQGRAAYLKARAFIDEHMQEDR
jgi:hypothetical protein